MQLSPRSKHANVSNRTRSPTEQFDISTLLSFWRCSMSLLRSGAVPRDHNDCDWSWSRSLAARGSRTHSSVEPSHGGPACDGGEITLTMTGDPLHTVLTYCPIHSEHIAELREQRKRPRSGVDPCAALTEAITSLLTHLPLSPFSASVREPAAACLRAPHHLPKPTTNAAPIAPQMYVSCAPKSIA